MTYLLVETKRGSYVRRKSEESTKNLDTVAPAKAATWKAFGQASYDAAGGSMEDIIQSVIDKMKGVAFKADKQKLPVTQEEYQELLIQSLKKGIPKSKLDTLVVIVAKKKPSVQEMVEKTLLEVKLP